MELPSKELLMAVSYVPTMNDYELMHSMKVWALTYGLVIRSSSDGTVVLDGGWISDDYCNSNTEFEAVTKACEWILNEK